MSYCKCDKCIHDAPNGGTEKACEKCLGWGGEEDMYCEMGSAKYPDHIMSIIRERLDLDSDDISRDNEINNMTANEVFENVLEYEGFSGYAYKIYSWIESIFGIDLQEE